MAKFKKPEPAEIKGESDTPPSSENLPPAPEPAETSMDALTIGEDFPKPDEEAIAAIMQNNQQAAVSNEPEKFNPTIHATDKQGNPSLTKSGKFRRKKNTQFINPEADAQKAALEKEAAEKAALASLEDARVVSGIIEQLSVKMISEDFRYEEIERESNVKAWQDTFNYYGGVNLTPPWRLALNHTAIIVARAQKPNVQSKLKLFGAWLKSKLKRRPKNGAHVSSRTDGQRQNHMGAKEGTQPTKA